MHVAAPRQVIAREILKGLHRLDLRNIASKRETMTGFMAACYLHRVRARAAGTVRVSRHGQWTAADHATVENVHRLLPSQRLVQVDLQLCASEPLHHVRLYVPLHHTDLGYMAAGEMLAAPAEWVGRVRADITTIVLPEWGEERSVLIDSDHADAYVLGSDYYGDIHNSVLRLAAERVGRQGGLCLHAAALELHARSRGTGQVNRCGVLLLGPGGAGKTALATHAYELDATAGEKAVIRQDDRVILHPDGRVQGLEGQGLYVRTAGLDPKQRPLPWAAVHHEDAVLENVWIGPAGRIDYADETLTPNGRAIVPLAAFPGFDGSIDLPKCTHVFFLVPDPSTPPATLLTATQAAEWLPRLEPADDRADVFHAFLQANPDVQCFALNTRLTLPQTAGTLLEICREGALP